MSKADLTRARILREARRQGAIRGFQSISLAEVADAAGVSKSAVFKHFGAKELLDRAVIETLCADFAASVWQPAADLPAGRARLDEIFERWLDWVDGASGDGGCGIIQAQIEFDDQPGPLREYLQKQQRLWNRTLAKEFRALSKDGDALQLAFEFRSFVLGYNQARRLLDDRSARGFAVTAYRSLIERALC